MIHSSTKPVQPKPIKDMTAKEYQEWSTAMSTWLWERDATAAREAVKGMASPLDVREKAMREKACSPRADYEWRDIPKRKSRAGNGCSKEHNRMREAARRARVRQAVLDVQRERDEAKP